MVNINDIWDQMKIKFSVLHTRIHNNQSIRLTGGIKELGNWDKVNPLVLNEEIDGRQRDEIVTYSRVINI